LRSSSQAASPRPAAGGAAPTFVQRPPPGAQQRLAAYSRPLTRNSALACLGLQAGLDLSPDDVRKAYKQAALRWHPDRVQNHDNADHAKSCFQEIRDAFEFLQRPADARAAAAGGC
jgi:hypothetical protein